MQPAFHLQLVGMDGLNSDIPACWQLGDVSSLNGLVHWRWIFWPLWEFLTWQSLSNEVKLERLRWTEWLKWWPSPISCADLDWLLKSDIAISGKLLPALEARDVLQCLFADSEWAHVHIHTYHVSAIVCVTAWAGGWGGFKWFQPMTMTRGHLCLSCTSKFK